MKKALKIFVTILIIFSLIPVNVFAIGDGNIDTGGGEMGSGTSTNVWSPENEGVRVTVVRTSDHAVVTTPIDITNRPPNSSIYNFGKVSKIQYNTGTKLRPKKGGYTCIKPTQSIPQIISDNGNGNIEAIKSYFTDEQVIRSIAILTGMNFDILIGGKYKLLLEPIAYYKFEGVMIATTATEAAMYDEQVNGLLRRRMVSLSHKNLPLAMFLETPDLGYPAWNGSTTQAIADTQIISSLGLGIVRFKDETEPPEIGTYDYEYRVNTEVITAVTVSGGQSDPDNPVSVSFDIQGIKYDVGNAFYPDGDSQLAWVKWTTPDTQQDMIINVSVQGSGAVSQSIIKIRITDLDKNEPPNPVADDRNDSFSYASVPEKAEKTRAEWGVWSPWWKANWVWVSDWDWVDTSYFDDDGNLIIDGYWEDNGSWVDKGWWEFDYNQYSASFCADMTIKTDIHNPTAKGRTMKSGYGINETVTARVSSNQSTAVTYPQNAVSYFPEFGYKTYWRLLERTQTGSSPKFKLQKNHFSTYNNRTHFTPIWMPDGPYKVNTWVIDSWTPDGMLSMNLTDSLKIKGSLWDDWHIAPLKP